MGTKPRRRRLTLPHPGNHARAAARILFRLPESEEPTVGQCWTAVDLAVHARTAGILPDDRTQAQVIYPERPGSGFCLCTQEPAIRPASASKG